MSAKVIAFPSVKKPERERLRVLVDENTGTVRCPRKGAMGAEISILICEMQHKENAGYCAEHRCQQALSLAPQIAALKARMNER